MKTAMLMISFIFLCCSGCADIKRPTLGQAITHPWGTKASLHSGMTKEQILHTWGEPDVVNNIGYDELGVAKEEWVYAGRFSKIPVDYRYIAKTKYLYFHGNSLVDIKDEEQVEEGQKKQN